MNLLKNQKELLSFYDRDRNKNIDLNSLTSGSRKIISWKCKNSHSFNRKMSEFKKSQSCPVCRINPVSNDKDLMKEWDYDKNSAQPPEKVSQGNNRLKVWWTCGHCDYNWKARVYSRTSKNAGCPKCASTKQHSKNEIRLYAELKSLFQNIFSDYKVENLSYDIYIKDINLLIEYDGYHWHKNSLEHDLKKNVIASNNGFDLIRLREKGLDKISKDDIVLPFDFNLRRDFKTQKELVNLLLVSIGEKFKIDFNVYIKNPEFLNLETYNKYENRIRHKNVVADNKELSSQWNYENNKGILPENVSLKTSTLYWWKCSEGEDHVWESSPSNRQVRKCPFCSNKKISITNRFDLQEEVLLKLWDFSINKNQPADYTNRNSKDKIHWNCGNCHKEIKKTIRDMVDTKGYCPHCKKYNK